MKSIEKSELGYRQQLVMKCVWNLGGKATVAQMIQEMDEKYGAKLTGQGMNTSVMLLLEKGLLRRIGKIHQAFVYEATISEEEFQHHELNRLRNVTFDGSAKSLVASFLNTQISKEELQEIRQLLEEKDEF